MLWLSLCRRVCVLVCLGEKAGQGGPTFAAPRDGALLITPKAFAADVDPPVWFLKDNFMVVGGAGVACVSFLAWCGRCGRCPSKSQRGEAAEEEGMSGCRDSHTHEEVPATEGKPCRATHSLTLYVPREVGGSVTL